MNDLDALQEVADSYAQEIKQLRTQLAEARKLLEMVADDGWFLPLEESQVDRVNAWLEATKLV